MEVRQQLHRGSLGPNHVTADYSLHHLEMMAAPQADALIPIDQKLTELVEVLVVAPPLMELHYVEARQVERPEKRLADLGGHHLDTVESG